MYARTCDFLKIWVNIEVEEFFKWKLDKHSTDKNFALKKKKKKSINNKDLATTMLTEV